MIIVEFIIRLFCLVDDRLRGHGKHPQGSLYPSEVVTLAFLFALKGTTYRAFYRWIARDLRPWFPRLLRLFHRHQDLTREFLGTPTFFTLMDTYGIELLHPRREGRSPRQIGRKGVSNDRWIVGIKLCWLLNDQRRVVAWAWDSADVHDQHFRWVAESSRERPSPWWIWDSA